MNYKKIFLLFFSSVFVFFFLPKETVFAGKIDCKKYKNTCPDESLISQIKKSCGTKILDSVYLACEEEEKDAQKRMAELSDKKAEIEKKEGSVSWYLSNLNYEIDNINAEIVNVKSNLDKINQELEKINKILKSQQDNLSSALRQVYEYDTSSYVEILLGNSSLAEFSKKIAEVESIQRNLGSSVVAVREMKEKLEKKKQEQLKYVKVQELSRQSLAGKKDQQHYLLSELKLAKTPIEREIARLKTQIKEIKSAIGRIQNYFGCWLTGGNPSWSQIFSAVSNSSSKANVDIFTMLGILEVESSFKTCAGKNVGSSEGNLQRCVDNRIDDSHCYREKPIFEQICENIGADPNKVPISYAYAMGPAQFIPSTWKGYQRLYPGLNNPWNLHDAVLAMAYKLKRAGVGCYNTCSAASWYVPRVNTTASRWKEIYQACKGFNLSCPNLRNYLENKGIPIR